MEKRKNERLLGCGDKDKTPIDSGKRLKKILKENGLNQNELADYLHYSPNHISMIVTGKRRLTPDIAYFVCSLIPGIRAEYLLCLDDWKTWDDVPEEYYSSQINKAWDSTDAAEELLEKLGYIFEWTGNAKMIDKDYADDEMPEYDRNDPCAYRLIVDGTEKGLCSSNQRESLIESITDYAEFEVKKLLSKVKKGSADNG